MECEFNFVETGKKFWWTVNHCVANCSNLAPIKGLHINNRAIRQSLPSHYIPYTNNLFTKMAVLKASPKEDKTSFTFCKKITSKEGHKGQNAGSRYSPLVTLYHICFYPLTTVEETIVFIHIHMCAHTTIACAAAGSVRVYAVPVIVLGAALLSMIF